jgi:hypothetical protein
MIRASSSSGDNTDYLAWVAQTTSLPSSASGSKTRYPANAAGPPDDPFILVDQGTFGNLFTASHRIIPFLQRDGKYQETPSDDAAAIEVLERLRRSGAVAIIIAWPASWWLAYYGGFKQYLQSNFHCSANNERLIAFDLRP